MGSTTHSLSLSLSLQLGIVPGRLTKISINRLPDPVKSIPSTSGLWNSKEITSCGLIPRIKP
ncbi:hypothetical protein RHMOL_Rhmol09G0012200 [Rhododendron molle]|uniref:Uncharacterized protein n=1 Tax=Rhododendron molle TaxID=49168 RepID=A0ACC0M8L4_RHOML|nr:hypothetical protein RHMOL_Rhmol09G0012200 [Rhododendron molle]